MSLGLAEAAQRRLRLAAGAALRVLVEHAGELGDDEARGNTVDADAVRPPGRGEVPRQRKIGELGDAVHRQLERGVQRSDRDDEDDRAVLALDHAGRHRLGEPEIRLHVVDHHPLENLVLEVVDRPVMRVDRGIADHDVDLAVSLMRFGDQVLALRLVGDAAGHRGRLAALGLDRRDDLLARLEVAAGDHDLGAGLGEEFRHRPADAARRAGDDGDFLRKDQREKGSSLIPCHAGDRREALGPGPMNTDSAGRVTGESINGDVGCLGSAQGHAAPRNDAS